MRITRTVKQLFEEYPGKKDEAEFIEALKLMVQMNGRMGLDLVGEGDELELLLPSDEHLTKYLLDKVKLL